MVMTTMMLATMLTKMEVGKKVVNKLLVESTCCCRSSWALEIILVLAGEPPLIRSPSSARATILGSLMITLLYLCRLTCFLFFLPHPIYREFHNELPGTYLLSRLVIVPDSFMTQPRAGWGVTRVNEQGFFLKFQNMPPKKNRKKCIVDIQLTFKGGWSLTIHRREQVDVILSVPGRQSQKPTQTIVILRWLEVFNGPRTTNHHCALAISKKKVFFFIETP